MNSIVVAHPQFVLLYVFFTFNRTVFYCAVRREWELNTAEILNRSSKVKSWGVWKINYTWQQLIKETNGWRWQLLHFILEKHLLFICKNNWKLVVVTEMFCPRKPICPLWKSTMSHHCEESLHNKNTWVNRNSTNKH